MAPEGQGVEAVDQRVRRAQLRLDGLPLRHALEHAQIGTGRESARLDRSDHQRVRADAGELVERLAELIEERLVEAVRLGACLVEEEPGDALFALVQLQVPVVAAMETA
jgi:hypothetical protein